MSRAYGKALDLKETGEQLDLLHDWLGQMPSQTGGFILSGPTFATIPF